MRIAARVRDGARYLILSTPIAIIGAGLVLHGANDSASAALLSCALLLTLAFALALASRRRLVSLLRRHALSIAAAIAFCVWTLLSTWRVSTDEAPAFLQSLFHPDWQQLLDGAHGAVSISPYRTFEGLAALLGPIAAFAIGALSVSDRQDRACLGRILCVLALCLSLYALVLYFEPETIGRRLRVNFGSANSAATIFGVLSLFLIARFFESDRHSPDTSPMPLMQCLTRRPLSFAALSLCLCCLFLTASRAGIAATILSCLVFFTLMAWPRRNASGRLSQLYPVFMLIGLLSLWGLPVMLDRMLLAGADAATRTLIVETHWRAFLDRPLLGHGMNSFHTLNSLYADPANWNALHNIGAAHNIYLQLLEETGLIGAAAFTLMLAPPLWGALRRALSARPGHIFAAAAFSAFALALLHGWVDFGLQTPAIAALLAFTLGATSPSARANAS